MLQIQKLNTKAAVALHKLLCWVMKKLEWDSFNCTYMGLYLLHTGTVLSKYVLSSIFTGASSYWVVFTDSLPPPRLLRMPDTSPSLVLLGGAVIEVHSQIHHLEGLFSQTYTVSQRSQTYPCCCRPWTTSTCLCEVVWYFSVINQQPSYIRTCKRIKTLSSPGVMSGSWSSWSRGHSQSVQ